MRALQPADRGQRREARGRDHRRGRELRRARAPRPGRPATPSTSCCAPTAPTASSGATSSCAAALEFGFYTEETDGVLLDKTKFFWNADYGHLSFTSDHHVVQNCDGMGAGDAAIYPGAAPETGSQATDFYPDAPRSNTVIRKCDMRNSALGYCGSMGNAVRITDNHIYGNATGIASDTLSSAGHPGLPGRQRQGRPQLHLREQLRRLRPEVAGQAARRRPDRRRDHLRGHERRPRSTTTGSSTTGGSGRSSSRCPTR